MRRILLLFLLLSVFFCSCADAEFYDDPSDGFASEDSVSDAEMSEKPRYMYAIVPLYFESEYMSGMLDTICRINLQTGDALPLCTDATCDHCVPWCTATNIRYFDITDDKSKVYYRKYKRGAGYGPIAGDGKEEDILYEYDTASFSLREIDRMEKNDYNFTVLAFDDGVVYNKFEVTETDEFGQTVSYENTFYKYHAEKGVQKLYSSDRLWIYNRQGQYAYSLRPEHVVWMDASMEQICTFGHDAAEVAARSRAAGESYTVFWETDDDKTSRVYAFVPNEDETYRSHLLSANAAYSCKLSDYVLIMEKVDGVASFVIRCMDPFTGELLYTVDTAKYFDQLGLEEVASVRPAAGRGAQMRVGNVQLFTAVDPYQIRTSFLFDAETGEIMRIDY